jgi:hypothetical protein
VDPDSQVNQVKMDSTELQELLVNPVGQDLLGHKANQEHQASMAALEAPANLAQLVD